MFSNKKGSSEGQPVAASELADDITATTSVAFRISGDSREPITELHLHIPLEEVIVKPPTVYQLPQVIRPRLPQPSRRASRPPPPLLRLGRPPSPTPTSSSSTTTSSSSTQLRDSVFCSDSGSDSSGEVEVREEER